MPIQFVNTTVPDGTEARVMLLENLAFRALVMPVEIPQDDAYAFSVWIKASEAGSVSVDLFGTSQNVDVGTAWQRVTMVVDSKSTDEVRLTTRTSAGYYIYRAMLETGNKPSDWSPSPEDDTKTLKNSAVIIDTDGITLESTGELRFLSGGGATMMVMSDSGIEMMGGEIAIKAGSAFRVQSDGVFQVDAEAENGNHINLGNKFSVDEQGNLTSVRANVDEMTVGGFPPWTGGNLIIASERPTVTPCLWLQPNGTTSINYAGSISSSIEYLDTADRAVLVSQSSSPTTLPGGLTYNYTLTVSIGNTSSENVRNIQIRATLSDGTHQVTGFLSESFTLGAKSSRVVTMSVYGSTVNVCGTTAPVTVTIGLARSVSSRNAIRLNPDYQHTLAAETPIASGLAVCTVYWCP